METNPINRKFAGSLATLAPHSYYPNTWETERLFLRPFSAEDLTDLYRVYGNPEVMRFIDKTGKTLSETEAELNSYIDHWKQHGFRNFAIIHKASNTLIGRTGLYRNQRSPYPQFGYILDQPYWGQGLAMEAAKANLEYGFNILYFPVIAAFSMLENQASRKILSQKLGMQLLTESFPYLGLKIAYYAIQRSQYLTNSLFSNFPSQPSSKRERHD